MISTPLDIVKIALNGNSVEPEAKPNIRSGPIAALDTVHGLVWSRISAA
jgi:hypothetical protein